MSRTTVMSLIALCALMDLTSAKRHGLFGHKVVSLRAGRQTPDQTGGGASSPWGDTQCPCIGLDNVKGQVAVASGLEAPHPPKLWYPAELGASCFAWDSLGHHPLCKEGADGDFVKDEATPAWCKQQWCYVDPCNCDIAVTPVISAYLPDATYQGHPVYYSYSTCGGLDSYTASEHKVACVNQKTEKLCTGLPKCSWDIPNNRCVGKQVLGVCNTAVDEKQFGMKHCKCVGIHDHEGSIEARVDGKKLMFPADYGSSCGAWEMDLHPDCAKPAGEQPGWCDKSWCFVDPCSCPLSEPPKVTAGWLGPTVVFQGKTLYYSYTTCGSPDLFTEKYNPDACVNQKDPQSCNALKKCEWVTHDMGHDNVYHCVGKEIAQTCHGPAIGPLDAIQQGGAAALMPLGALALLLAHM